MVEAHRYLVALVLWAGAAPGADLAYWVEPCTRAETGCKPADPELAGWAMEAWQAAGGGSLKLRRAAQMDGARIRIHWISGREGLYGETRGGDVYVRPEPGTGLRRDAIVYLTCLHESGHALGLRHTADFGDIMYDFQYGGDITEYFGRYIRQLTRRRDIRKISGISLNDRAQLMRIFGEK
ncbi:MAG: hypothetical protein KGN36_15635 [Acidobacteriota bacterium]|nr:hypothetical protein [Acidobacteriota bacterium]